ncbi:MAG: hypothetical protein IJ914_04075 [Prevotella sp.]|nr:hypothetical protein [Prevotella sp.]
MKYIRTLTVLTDAEILQREIPLFRGAVIHSLGEHPNVYFHNHLDNDKYRYAYPLIQYKRLSGKAAIVCVEDGVDIIGQFLTEVDGTLTIGDRQVTCNTGRIQPARILVQTWEEMFSYHISRWLPLNSQNYQRYKGIEGVVEKVSFLENILKANLLSMLKGLDIHLEKELILKITEISDSYLIYNKGVKMMAFNADFKCNLSIPNNIGIGKNASIGCGRVHQLRKGKDINNNTNQ